MRVKLQVHALQNAIKDPVELTHSFREKNPQKNIIAASAFSLQRDIAGNFFKALTDIRKE